MFVGRIWPICNLQTDTFRFTYHGYGVSHIDALCHITYNDRFYNDAPKSLNTPEGCGRLGIEHLKHGIVTRGVLIDVPRLTARGESLRCIRAAMHPA